MDFLDFIFKFVQSCIKSHVIFFLGFYVDRGEFDIYGTTILKIEMLNWKYYS